MSESPNVFQNPDYPASQPGLTKRELFAAMALQGLLSGEQTWGPWAVRDAVIAADQLIAELAKEPSK